MYILNKNVSMHSSQQEYQIFYENIEAEWRIYASD